MPKILVTGGTGFVGRAVVKKLLADGHAVRLLVRSGAAVPEGVETILGGLDNPAALDRACVGVDAVVHLVGIIAERGGQTFEEVHVEGTRAVALAARRAGVFRYVHMSALGARPGAEARYSRTKAEAEEIVRQSGLSWTIFRPSIIFGPGDQFVNQFAALFRFPWNWLQLHSFPLIGGGKTKLQPIAVEEVAAAFAGALARSESVGKTYDLVGPEPVSLREILEEVATATGTPYVVEGLPPVRLIARAALWAFVKLVPLCALALYFLAPGFLREHEAGLAVVPFVWLPAFVLALRWRRLILFPLPWTVTAWAAKLLERLPQAPLTREQVKMLHHDNTGDPAPAVALFGLTQTPFRAGIRAYLSPTS